LEREVGGAFSFHVGQVLYLPSKAIEFSTGTSRYQFLDNISAISAPITRDAPHRFLLVFRLLSVYLRKYYPIFNTVRKPERTFQ
jgi:hypothetical protein